MRYTTLFFAAMVVTILLLAGCATVSKTAQPVQEVFDCPGLEVPTIPDEYQEALIEWGMDPSATRYHRASHYRGVTFEVNIYGDRERFPNQWQDWDHPAIVFRHDVAAGQTCPPEITLADMKIVGSDGREPSDLAGWLEWVKKFVAFGQEQRQKQKK